MISESLSKTSIPTEGKRFSKLVQALGAVATQELFLASKIVRRSNLPHAAIHQRHVKRNTSKRSSSQVGKSRTTKTSIALPNGFVMGVRYDGKKRDIVLSSYVRVDCDGTRHPRYERIGDDVTIKASKIASAATMLGLAAKEKYQSLVAMTVSTELPDDGLRFDQ